MNCTNDAREAKAVLLADLRRQEAESRLELDNPALLKVTRVCVAERIARLQARIRVLCVELGQRVETQVLGVQAGAGVRL